MYGAFTMKSLTLAVLRLVFCTSSLKAISMGESMEREPLQPIFNTTSINVTATAGDTVILPCIADNLDKTILLIWTNPRVTLISTGDSRRIDDSRMSIERPKVRDWNLMIRDVRYNDTGKYMCIINTEPILSRTVYLFITVPPEITDYSTSGYVSVREGQTVELVCNATGVPMPVVTWYKQTDGYVRSELVDEHGESAMPGEVLILHNISRYCDGKYECNADNGVPPVAYKIFEVTVQFPPEVRIPTSRISQEVGKETMLVCNVAASPQGQITWMRDGRELPVFTNKMTRFILDIFDEAPHEKSLTLNIINLEKADFGNYTCLASNTLGEDSETVLLAEHFSRRYITTTTTTRRPPLPPSSNTKVNDKGFTYNAAVNGQGPFNEVHSGTFESSRAAGACSLTSSVVLVVVLLCYVTMATT